MTGMKLTSCRQCNTDCLRDWLGDKSYAHRCHVDDSEDWGGVAGFLELVQEVDERFLIDPAVLQRRGICTNEAPILASRATLRQDDWARKTTRRCVVGWRSSRMASDKLLHDFVDSLRWQRLVVIGELGVGICLSSFIERPILRVACSGVEGFGFLGRSGPGAFQLEPMWA